ncbi:MAG TPA: GGDEF domain-containing protein, partial [Bauldia sp.]|nr:GGDEF domain-containing protein [Bauldia sp.]
DVLTDTFNRRGFLRLAEREFNRSRRNGQLLTLIMIDIDHFKAVNDNFGHAAGDMILAAVANTCRKQIRSIDVLARFGGEEFIILVDALIEEAEGIARRLHKGIAESRATTIKGEISVTASFGIATVDPAAVDLETGIRLADEALYEAKNSGRNCIRKRA